jgi:hypothetical protein
MKKNQWIIWCFMLWSSASVIAQELTPFVVSSSGGFYSNSAGMLSITTGEMTAVETFSSPVWTLTQGFQQPEDFGTFVSDPDALFTFGIYPNPSEGLFTLVTQTNIGTHLDVRILTILGVEVFRTEYYQSTEINVRPVHLNDIAPGTYLVAVTGKESKTGNKDQFVTKIQIVR